MKHRQVIIFALFLFALCRTDVADAAEIEFFAGSASKPATEELVRLFEAETGHTIKLFLGSSGNLLSQMKIAHRGDVYFPGSPDYMKIAVQDGIVTPESERIVTYLIPAINVQRGNPKGIKELRDLAGKDIRVAIGNPHHVCVGLYAVEILFYNNLATEVRPRIIGHTDSCANTANIVAVGGADAVLGWRVFEFWNPEKIETVPLRPDQMPRISYMPIAVSTFSRNAELAGRLVEYFCSEKGKRIFEKWGYITREEEARKHAPEARIGGDYILPEGW